jgi:hypothetical protein
VSLDCLNGCCTKEICKTKAEINTKKRRKKLGMISRQRGMGKVGKLLLNGGPKCNKGFVTLWPCHLH